MNFNFKYFMNACDQIGSIRLLTELFTSNAYSLHLLHIGHCLLQNCRRILETVNFWSLPNRNVEFVMFFANENWKNITSAIFTAPDEIAKHEIFKQFTASQSQSFLTANILQHFWNYTITTNILYLHQQVWVVSFVFVHSTTPKRILYTG